MRILIADDERISRKTMQKIMDSMGECVVADNGSEALELFTEAMATETQFDLILLDVGMPEVDGIQVLSSIRDLESNKKIPRSKRSKVLMVTVHSDRETVLRCIKAGCDEYIVKPVNQKKLLSKLYNLGIWVKPEFRVKHTGDKEE